MTEYLSTQELAKLLGMSPTYVRDRLVKRPDFPRPALSLSQKLRRWNSIDVGNWIIQQQASINR